MKGDIHILWRRAIPRDLVDRWIPVSADDQDDFDERIPRNSRGLPPGCYEYVAAHRPNDRIGTMTARQFLEQMRREAIAEGART